jgi:predicted nucleotidyltransferase component of viral defense system
MAFREVYRRQVALLIRLLPVVAGEKDFALKGGTAINLFVRDMPRRSVDIDLTYLPVAPRAESLKAIDAAMRSLAHAIEQAVPGSRVALGAPHDGAITKLLVRSDGVQTKIEVTPVSRGTVFPAQIASVVEVVEEAFGFAEAQLVSHADLYAGKLVAGLDRQHPRDLFDVRALLAAEGITDELRQAFIAYMLCHNRPMAEVLAPTRKDIRVPFEREFEGMTDEPVALDELLAAREALIDQVVGNMPEAHRRFLVGFESGEPDWSLLGLPDVARLPAVIWRQQNLDSLSRERRDELVVALERALSSRPRG